MSRPAALDRVQIAGLGNSIADLREQARVAEAAGIDCVWAVELFRSSLTQAMWLAALDRPGRRGHRDRVGLHPQPDDDRALGARHRRGLRRAVPPRSRRRGQAAERDLARRRLRASGAAPARDGGGGAADHRARRRRRADPLRGRVPRHRHQGLGPPAPEGPRDDPDLHRGRSGGDGADGRGRRRRDDRPPDVLGAVARRGPGGELRARPPALRPRARELRLPARGLLRDRRRRGGRLRGGAADDLLLRDGPHVRAVVGDARLRRGRGGGRRRVPARRLRGDAGQRPRRDGRRLLRRRSPGQGPRAGGDGGRAWRWRSGSGRRPTSSPRSRSPAYQQRIVDAFAPSA